MSCIDQLVAQADVLTAKTARIEAMRAELRADVAELDAKRRQLSLSQEPQCHEIDCPCQLTPQARRALITS